LLRNPIRGGQGPNWAVEPYDDDDDEEGDRERKMEQLHNEELRNVYLEKMEEMEYARHLERAKS
jgi:hypothetical protein